MWNMFKAGAPLLISAGVVAPFLFPFVFGEEWGRAGIILAWLTPWYILQLVASPVSMALHVSGRVSWAMWLQLAGAIIRIGCVLYASEIHPMVVTEVFAISSLGFYAINIAVLWVAMQRWEE